MTRPSHRLLKNVDLFYQGRSFAHSLTPAFKDNRNPIELRVKLIPRRGVSSH
jgi:hypothetical protein